MTPEEELRHIAAQPAPPCDEFNCSKQHLCAVNGWACTAFVEYANLGPIRKPDFSNPDERPNAHNFYEKLGMRLIPRASQKHYI